MTITIMNSEVWRLDFTTHEMIEIDEFLDIIQIPMQTFGGLALNSPWVLVKAKLAKPMLKKYNTDELFKVGERVGNKIEMTLDPTVNTEKYKKLLSAAYKISPNSVRKEAVSIIKEYIPSGFFIKK